LELRRVRIHAFFLCKFRVETQISMVVCGKRTDQSLRTTFIYSQGASRRVRSIGNGPSFGRKTTRNWTRPSKSGGAWRLIKVECKVVGYECTFFGRRRQRLLYYLKAIYHHPKDPSLGGTRALRIAQRVLLETVHVEGRH
jgi:hypothetical protein